MHLRKGGMMTTHVVEENCSANTKISKHKLLFFLIFSSLLYCCSLLLSFPSFHSTYYLFYSYGGEDGLIEKDESISDSKASLCSSVPFGGICCDRSSSRSDICIMKGDIRTSSTSSSVVLYTSRHVSGDIVAGEELQHEKIKPYPRKFEPSVVAKVGELNIISKKRNASTIENQHKCDVNHGVPAVFFSTGGYTRNLYHAFNDGLIPLYITSQHFNKKVVFVILEYRPWWVKKYGDILSQLSDYEPVDLAGDNRTHCFYEAIVGLRFHDELAINSSLMKDNKTIKDFRHLLDKAYSPRIQRLIHEEPLENPKLDKPKMVIILRKGTRSITNEDLLVKMAEKVGFLVEILRPDGTIELAKMYRSLNSSDVMMGVHGDAMTHLLFMKPGSVLIQVVPIGTKWIAESCFGGPGKKLGLRYIGYNILPQESSLYDEYNSNDVVLTDPKNVNHRGWKFTRNIYLRQNVRLNLVRFRKVLVRSYSYIMADRNQTLAQTQVRTQP